MHLTLVMKMFKHLPTRHESQEVLRNDCWVCLNFFYGMQEYPCKIRDVTA